MRSKRKKISQEVRELKEIDLLREILGYIDELYERVEGDLSRGRPKIYSYLSILKILVVMLMKKIKTFEGIHRFLINSPSIAAECGLGEIPSRRTLSRRLKALSPLVKEQIETLGKHFLGLKVIRGKTLSADKTLLEAKGPKWHKEDREKGVIPKGLRGVDVDSEWGKSGYQGWVQGYGLHLLVNADKGDYLIPLSAFADKGNSAENKVFKEHFVHSLSSC